MVLLSVLDVVLVVLGGAGMLYQAVCIVISLFAKPIKFPEAPMNKRYAVLISERTSSATSSTVCIRKPIRASSSTSGWWPTTAPTTPPKWPETWDATSSNDSTRSRSAKATR